MSANATMERYIALWNEPDATVRRAAVAALWRPDGLHLTPTRRFRGTEELVARVTEAYDRFVGGQGLRFRSGGELMRNHGALAFDWVMTPEDRKDKVLAAGFDVVLLDSDGRIAADYQFNEPSEALDGPDGQVERYLAVTDAARHYLPGARLVDGDGVHEGPHSIAAALVDGGARLLTGSTSAQHDALRYRWRQDSTDERSGERAEGVDFLLHDGTGQIREHHRFTRTGRYAG
ncbi:hypothetical protein [Streptomyces sp. NPDC060198]|uniref:hypothetical protein n=1 Tax=Streptomyces sp. NPDC060198 TaxID=3347070 RepID=UPI0036583181